MNVGASARTRDSPAAGADLSSEIYEHMIRAQRAVILLNEERRKYWMLWHLGELLQSADVAARKRETTVEHLRDVQYQGKRKKARERERREGERGRRVRDKVNRAN